MKFRSTWSTASTSCNRSKSRSQRNSNLKDCCQQKKQHITVVLFGNIEWMVDHWCPQLSIDLSERRRRQNDATIQDILKLNWMVQSAKSIECKMKVHSIPPSKKKKPRVHGSTRCSTYHVEGGASQQAHVIVTVYKNVTERKCQPHF